MADASDTKVTAAAEIEGIEVLRVVACIAVIWLHASQTLQAPLRHWSALGEVGVPTFVAVAMLLLCRACAKVPQPSLVSATWQRFLRIVWPWLVWSAGYLGLELIKARLTGRAFHLPEQIWLQGGTREYWFLPFLFTISVTLLPPLRLVGRKPRLLWPAIAIAVTSSLALYAVRLDLAGELLGAGTPAIEWLEQLPMVPLAVAIGLALQRWPRLPSLTSARALAAVGMVLGLALLWVATRHAAHLVGLSAVALATATPRVGWLRPVARLGQHTFAVYLVHVIVLWPIYALARRAGAFGLVELTLATVLVFVVSMAIVMLIRRIPGLRWLVP